MKKEKNTIECPNCHQEVKSSDKFCNNCGEKLEPIIEQEEIVVETVPRRGRPKKIIDKDMEEEMKKKAVMAKDMVVRQTEKNSEETVKEYIEDSYTPNTNNTIYSNDNFNPYNQVNNGIYSQVNNNPYNQINNMPKPKKRKMTLLKVRKNMSIPSLLSLLLLSYVLVLLVYSIISI